jgi:3',5'-cyclic AMP phosphodiesterase CpdA
MRGVGDSEKAMRGGQSLRIIHLSDVHFGEEHRFGGEKAPGGDFIPGGPSLAESIRADLAKLKADKANAEPEPPQIVCLTGDLTQKALGGEFEKAVRFCRELCEGDARLGPLAVVPGNHDVDWTQDKGQNTSRMRPWSLFRLELFGERNDWARDARDACVRTDLVESHGVIIAEINSCRFVQKDPSTDTHRGRVSDEALSSLETQLEELDPEVNRSCVKIALVHHHPILIPDLTEGGRGYDAIVGSGDLLRTLRQYGFHLLLHGHKHIPFTFTEDSLSAQELSAQETEPQGRRGYPLFVVCGGSASSGDLPDQRPAVNCYNRIEIKWLPDAGQFRCRVETRELVRTTSNNKPLRRDRWYWRELSRDDRSFRREQSSSGSNVPPLRRFDKEKGDDDGLRKGQYRLSRDWLPVVVVRPSLTPGQSHEAIVELRKHESEDDGPSEGSTEPITSVRWSAGRRHDVFELQEDSADQFRAVFSYYGAMLIQGFITWRDGYTANVFIYAQLEEIEQ